MLFRVLTNQRLPDSPLTDVLRRIKPSFTDVGLFSLFINLLTLTGSLYMLQVYDRVLASRSHYTLLYLTLVCVAALGVMAALDVVRSRILVRLGACFDASLAPEVFTKVLNQGGSGQPLRDMQSLRGFLTGNTIISLLDAPWSPIFLLFVYLLHPYLGHVALCGVFLLFVIAYVNDLATREPLARAGEAMASTTQYAENSARNAEVVRAMGMLPGLLRIWRGRNELGLQLQAVASDRAAVTAALAKFLRFFVQMAILGVGAYLVIEQQCTPGAMIAASIMMGRALAPVESAIGSWRSFLQARVAYTRLQELFARHPAEKERMPLPAPKGALSVDNVVGVPPGGEKPVITGATFKLQAGQCLGITGPSAAGKSSLVRLLVGIWAPRSGTVRLDGVNLADWPREEVGPHIGYLPQDVELFQGTVAENIARFGQVDPDKVVAASQLANAHEMILSFPKGYDTLVGAGGMGLSGGQRQRLGLARAVYGLPALVVLDEPTSSMDADGENSVRGAIEQLKQQGKTVIVIGHRPALLSGVDVVLVVQRGTITAFGPASEVMPQITRKVFTRLEPPPVASAG
ncbi:MAG: type I secretion system permease/ATPase [Betaproteobacteria bacterium]|nr:type I secretion system permease/ATPase [Betaproteobacteria bacterium]